MNDFFNIIAHSFITVGLLGVIISIGYLITRTQYSLRIVIRTLSAMIGIFIYIASKSVGLSIPDMILSAVSLTFSMPVSGVAGVLVAGLFVQYIKKSNEIASRIIIMIMSFIVIMFGDVYVASLDVVNQEGHLNTTLLPSLSFVISISIYIIFTYDNVRGRYRKN